MANNNNKKSVNKIIMTAREMMITVCLCIYIYIV